MAALTRALVAVLTAEHGCPLAWLGVLLGAAWARGHWGRWL